MKTPLSFAEMKQVLSASHLLVKDRAPAPGDTRRAPLTTNWKQASPADALLVYKGVSFDPHTQLSSLTSAPSWVILEDAAYCDALTVPWLLVTDAREAWAYLEAAAWGNPQDSLAIVGITGTNGKTSTTWLLRDLMQRVTGAPSFSIGTIGCWIGEEFFPTDHTTPDPPALFELLALARDRGARFGAMEVTSHALMHGKLGPIRFSGAGFTSFSRDHLDFHGTMEAYLDAKWRLFTAYLKTPDAPCGISDDVLPQIAGRTLPRECFTYSLVPQEGPQPFIMAVTAADAFGCTVEWTNGAGVKQKARVPFLGDYAAKNLALAIRLCERVTQGVVTEQAVAKVPPIAGRMEPVKPLGAKDLRMGYVDYAHTPDALEKALKLLRPVTPGKLVVVFGCGGDRDKGKRPQMGLIASQMADRVIVTSDNPRTERAEMILDEIVAGIVSRPGLTVEVQGDRRTAIVAACRSMVAGDVLLVAGKGHEDYQIIGKEKLPFDDRKILAEAWRAS